VHSTAIVLHEDKKYYPDAAEVFGPDVETLVQEEDTQPLTERIVAPIKVKKFAIVEKDLPPTTYQKECVAAVTPEGDGRRGTVGSHELRPRQGAVPPCRYLVELMNFPQSTRNLALVGHLHHGKTSFLDMLFLQCHQVKWELESEVRDGVTILVVSCAGLIPRRPATSCGTPYRCADALSGLVERGAGTADEHQGQAVVARVAHAQWQVLHAQPNRHARCVPNCFMETGAAWLALIAPYRTAAPGSLGCAHATGHVNFSDEVTAALRVADAAVIVVDAVEGVMVHTERMLRHVIQERLPFVVVINKVDRLILELKLPPSDAYFKLRHTLDEINAIASAASLGRQEMRVSPELGNVCFASSQNGWSFTLQSFAKIYSETHGSSTRSLIEARACVRS